MEYSTTEEDMQQHNRAADGIEGIAVRIHERAVQLSNEQELLRHAEQELQELKEQLEQEKEKNQVVRGTYLQNVMEMNSIEMECIQMEASIKERINKTENIKEKEKEILACLTNKNVEWNFTEESLTRHKLRQELYLKVFQGAIDERTQSVSHRKSRLDTAHQLTEEMKQKGILSIHKQGRLKVDLKRIADAEQQENKVIDTLASQVRDTLAKVRTKTRLFETIENIDLLFLNHLLCVIAAI